MRNTLILLDPQALQQARQNLEQDGFRVESAPVMLEVGVVLTAFREADGEGFLLTAPEVRLVALYGLAALDPHREPDDSRPRWQREDSKNRVDKYIEAAIARAIAEVASAPVGNRNNTLSRAAYGLGQLEHLGLDRERVQQELEQAALAVGLTLGEARPTIRRAFEAGSREPRELPADLAQSAKGSANPFALNKRDNKGQNRFSANRAKYQSVFARKRGKP